MRKTASAVSVLMVFVLGAVSVFVPSASGAPRKVTLWSYSANNVQEWNLRKADIENRFKIALNVVRMAEDVFVQELRMQMAGGSECPDLIDWRIENNQVIHTNARESLVLPLDSYTRKSSTFAGVALGQLSWVSRGDQVYGLPREAGAAVLVYNDSIWKSVGVDLATVETWDDFFLAAQKLAAEKKDGKPVHYALPTQGKGLSDTMFMIWQQSGAPILDRAGAANFTNPGFKGFVEQWAKWTRTGSFISWDWGAFPALLRSGTLCSYVAPDWMVGQVDQASNARQHQFKVRALPLYRQGGPRTATWRGSFLALVRTALHPDDLYPIMEYMQYGENGMGARLRVSSVLPPLVRPSNSASFLQPDPRFGGQNLRQLQMNLMSEVPSISCSDMLWDAIEDFNSEYPQLESGRSTVDQVLANAQARASRRIRVIQPLRPDNRKSIPTQPRR